MLKCEFSLMDIPVLSSALLPLFLGGIETCWEGRVWRQKCLRNCIGSIVSIWWTLHVSPEKNSDPSIFSEYVRRGCSLINIINVLNSIGSGYEIKQDFGQAVVNEKSFWNTISAASAFPSHYSDFCRPSKGWPEDVIIWLICVTGLGLQPYKSKQAYKTERR